MGVSSLITDGLSICFSDYFANKAKLEVIKVKRAAEELLVKNYLDGEKSGVEQIYIEKGLNEDDADIIVEILSRNPEIWVDMIMSQELCLENVDQTPWENGLIIFAGFIIFGFFPLIPYVIGVSYGISKGLFEFSLFFTIVGLFLLGMMRTRFTGKKFFISAIESISIGLFASFCSYLMARIIHILSFI